MLCVRTRMGGRRVVVRRGGSRCRSVRRWRRRRCREGGGRRVRWNGCGCGRGGHVRGGRRSLGSRHPGERQLFVLGGARRSVWALHLCYKKGCKARVQLRIREVEPPLFSLDAHKKRQGACVAPLPQPRGSFARLPFFGPRMWVTSPRPSSRNEHLPSPVSPEARAVFPSAPPSFPFALRRCGRGAEGGPAAVCGPERVPREDDEASR